MPRLFDVRRLAVAFALLVPVSTFGCLAPAAATPALTMDIASGEVLYAKDATQPWYPASTTKLMTVYVALNAVRDHQIAMNTPLVISARAHKMPPSKMGFPVGTQVTLDNALKMLMVRSANDIAITIAEGIGGSVEGFADDMNRAAADLGLHESHFVNPNGLPDPDHYSSARDMAIIARALYAQFPDQASLFNLGALSMGREIIENHNVLLGRYPGADGMKTGFTCAAGFNIVASAFRDGRRIVAIVFGAPTVAERSAKIAALFDRGFANVDRPSGSILTLPSMPGAPPDMRDRVCRNRAPLIAQFKAEVETLDAPLVAPSATPGFSVFQPERAFLLNTQNVVQNEPTALHINSMPSPVFDPVPVRIGADPGYTGVVAQARAPHTPVGSEPQPVTATAYAAAPAGEPLQGIAGTPLAVDVNTLPLRGRKVKPARARRGSPTLNAAAEAPKTKVIAGETAKGKPAAKTSTKTAKAKPAPKASRTAAKPAPRPAKAAAKPGKAKAAAVKGNKKVKSASQ